MEKQLYQLLLKHWNYSQFREGQIEIISSVANGIDTLAILPTGTGKSLCYQISGLYLGGLTLVVSPLIALMREQAAQLRNKGIKALAIDGSMSKRTIDITIDNAVYDKYAFLFMSPERLQSKLLLDRIEKLNIKLLAIDEAHCISEWGHDFRPAYRNILNFKELIPDVPVIALTATATHQVKQDIVTNLKLNNPRIFSYSPRRVNLSYRCIESLYKKGDILKILKKEHRLPAIIYCHRIKSVVEIAHWLKQNNIKAAAFYGRLENKDKAKILGQWDNGELQLIVATKAFGMGMDKANVRTVIHFDIPESIEAYTQEAGRAGRDGNYSEVYLIYSSSDLDSQRHLIEYNYPPKSLIKSVYKCLTQYFNIGSGIQTNKSFNFDLEDFALKYNLNLALTQKSLHILHQQDTLSLSDDLIHPSFLKLNEQASKQLLGSDRISDMMKKFVKTILRMYEGILLSKVKIDEQLIAHRAQMDINKVIAGLNWLDANAYAEYELKFSGRKINFFSNRLKNNELVIQKYVYDDKIQRLDEKISKVQDYIRHIGCRQVFIESYFGFNSEETCGICDFCLNKDKTSDLDLPTAIIKHIDLNNSTLEELIESIGFKYKLEVIKAVQSLLNENKIFYRDKKFYPKP